MSLISKLKAVVAGDDYLDDDFDELDYASEEELDSINYQKQNKNNEFEVEIRSIPDDCFTVVMTNTIKYLDKQNILEIET